MPLVPSSSLSAVVTKSTGVLRDQLRIVRRPLVGGGEQDRQHDRQQRDDAERDRRLLDDVVVAVGPVVLAGGVVEARVRSR